MMNPPSEPGMKMLAFIAIAEPFDGSDPVLEANFCVHREMRMDEVLLACAQLRALCDKEVEHIRNQVCMDSEDVDAVALMFRTAYDEAMRRSPDELNTMWRKDPQPPEDGGLSLPPRT